MDKDIHERFEAQGERLYQLNGSLEWLSLAIEEIHKIIEMYTSYPIEEWRRLIEEKEEQSE